ncbi:hypothetical protein L596_007980 [Steinernema carpocapsae]|uniref:Prefoldin subunit 3 n=1 Tax=Steinernema carpocapsae TaxID=34508 RepID=A0A4U5PBM4_STECR|nr:hypothetical protein L596_007980 [Steinernema carpocapsae]
MAAAVATPKMTAEDRVNARRVPAVQPLEDVEKFVEQVGNYSEASAQIENQYKTMKYMQANLMATRERIVDSLPDLKNNLKILHTLTKKKENEKPFTTSFMLADQIYTKAEVKKVENVSLWLGAGVMAEFPINEATDFMQGKVNELSSKAAELAEDLEVIKKRLTTLEVNMANMYNYGVRKRKMQSASK